jgi:ADP-dependent NAD(P)H-hydrate dehydratase / NAD(P)H-hydrate epimerase
MLGIFAGSDRYPGSAVLCAEAATRTGAGYTYVVTTETVAPVIWNRCPSLTVFSEKALAGALPETVLDTTASFVARADALIIGPGLTVTPDTRRIVMKIFTTHERPCVIDADGLNALASGEESTLRELKKELSQVHRATRILTPHAGELERLLSLCTRLNSGHDDYQGLPEMQHQGEFEDALRSHIQRTGNSEVREYIGKAIAIARALNCIVVAKGPLTAIVSRDKVYVSDTGTPALAKAGTGDVLAGIIGSLAAQGVEPFDAAALGVHIHGRAGCLAEREWGQRGVCAEDVIAHISLAMRDFFAS